MNNSTGQDNFDHSSDPAFLADYVEKSASQSTRDHFRRIRDRVLALMAERQQASGRLRVLDIGCGAGTQARLWAELGHEVSGLDVNAPLLEVARMRAREENLDIYFDVGSATNLPQADGSIDVCLLLELLEHVGDWQTCIQEAVRVLRPGGVLYLSSTNALCPKQQEFNLPLYSWYPAAVKRHYEHLAVSTRPELANHARYPAVNWFTFYSLQRFLANLGVQCMDRFDLLDVSGKSKAVQTMVWAVRNLPPLRFAAHMATPGTMVFGIKQEPALAPKNSVHS